MLTGFKLMGVKRRTILLAIVLATALLFAYFLLPQFLHYFGGKSTSTSRGAVGVYGDPSEFTEFYAFDLFKPTCAKHVNCTNVDLIVNEVFAHTEWRPRFFLVSVPDLSDYSLLLLRVSGLVELGRQYDRLLWIFVNGIPVFWGSTTMHSNFTSEVDVTLFKELFKGVLNITVYLPNWIIPERGLTGMFRVNVSLVACKLNETPRDMPTHFTPLWSEELFRDVGPENSTSAMVKIPDDVCRVFLFLRIKGRGREEFWYREIPSLRNVLVYYNEKLVGVYSPYPVIYTGGIFPAYWNPQPSVNTLADKTLYFFDITPLALTEKEGNVTLVILGISESANLTKETHQLHITGGLIAWRCRQGLVNISYTRNVDFNKVEDLEMGIPKYSGNLTYAGSYVYTLYYGNYNCTYKYDFGGKAIALRNATNYAVSQLFNISTRALSGEEACKFFYVASGLYVIDAVSNTTLKQRPTISEVEHYEQSSSDKVALVFDQYVAINNYESLVNEALSLGGYFDVGLAKTAQATIVTRIYDFYSITHKSLNATLRLGAQSLRTSGFAKSATSRVNEKGWYLEFKISCSLSTGEG